MLTHLAPPERWQAAPWNLWLVSTTEKGEKPVLLVRLFPFNASTVPATNEKECAILARVARP
jgi:hypothetical protein